MSNLKNKNIIVTGASGGIGNSIVEKLYDNGANILATGTKLEKLEKLKQNFKNIKILKFDISQHEKIEEFINNATEELGGSLDCIINNAGYTGPKRNALVGHQSIKDFSFAPVQLVSVYLDTTLRCVIFDSQVPTGLCE